MGGERLRLFVAMDITEEARRTIAACVERHGSGLAEARWVRPENLHITLKFIGEYEEEKLGRLSNEIRETAALCRAFRAALGGCGGFPSRKKARVIWVGMEAGQAEAAAIAAKLDSRLERVGVKREDRPFKGHLTLARLRKPVDCSPLLDKMEVELQHLAEMPFEVRKMTLYRSILGPGGPRYLPLERVDLGAA